VGLKHALENIKRNGGRVSGNEVTIQIQEAVPVRFEKSFDGVFPIIKIPAHWSPEKDFIYFGFDGTGFVLKGEAISKSPNAEYTFHTELYVDGKMIGKPVLPTGFNSRSQELCWNYDLKQGRHEVKLKIINPAPEAEIRPGEAIIFSSLPSDGLRANPN
jgi:hypothetical protein